jgi:predicted small metal-binding protein
LRKVLHCECGFEARAEDEGKLVEQVQRHALQAHGMTLSREDVLLLAFRAQLDEMAWPSRLATGSPHQASRDGSGAEAPDERRG